MRLTLTFMSRTHNHRKRRIYFLMTEKVKL
jgi:hypothetical protein